ncbi:response regulator transcription factor [Alloacidobacterium dinghuense]|uniref:Response regulator transcription factor n=1 Tax=Alloacidobacterium dinghuense TaxID=2763107 RepID=A0A7G8BCT2_9BACT|nr:response regulator transcription factor [Alloacidobacterium dinghuense]QNI30352.1 response regulator transcription factor [Alloacidobacterium dinghuense]
MTSEAKQRTNESAVPATNGAAGVPHTKPVIRVVMADSQAIYRVGMRKVFAVEDDIQIVSQVDSLTALFAALQQHPADVLVLEGNLLAGKGSGIADILHHAANLKIIVQATATDENHIVELYRRGVRGVIPRSISPDLLVKCVRKIAAGETWIDNQSVTWVIEAYRTQASALASPKNQPRLSPKELAIINCITQGKRNKEIAYELGTSEQVIKNYLRKIYDKLGVSDRLELALYCLHHHIQSKGGEAEARASIEAALGETAKI